ncbi:MAG: hypothetical protein M3Y72_10060 [Acidobacteriota bacterium]|nr:hypothetical protein [Acidobacteriota bacterium]
MNDSRLGIVALAILLCAPALFQLSAIMTVKLPADTGERWLVSGLTYLVLMVIVVASAGLIFDRKKTLSGLALLLSVFGVAYMLGTGLFSLGFWP